MKKLLLLTVAALVIQATPALADHHGGEGHGKKEYGKKSKMFEKHDTNGDGVISEAEFLAHAKEKFAKKDANGDGFISKDEAKAAHEAKRGKKKGKRGNWNKKRVQDSAE